MNRRGLGRGCYAHIKKTMEDLMIPNAVPDILIACDSMAVVYCVTVEGSPSRRCRLSYQSLLI
jgi:hypothetical protein